MSFQVDFLAATKRILLVKMNPGLAFMECLFLYIILKAL